MDIKQATSKAVTNNAEALVKATSAHDVEALADRIAEDIERYSPRNDRLVNRIVISALCAALLIVVVIYGIWTLTPLADGAATRPDLPDALIAIGSAAIGALASLINPSGR